ncbi:hypothetical protein ACFL2D_00230 [Patescibacteria group bacterium]
MCPVDADIDFLTAENAIDYDRCIFTFGADTYTDEAAGDTCNRTGYLARENGALCEDHETMPRNLYYKRNYQGIGSIEWIDPADVNEPPKVITINHGENKNELFDATDDFPGICIQNSINNYPCSECSFKCEVGGSACEACWPSYSGFVTMNYVTATAVNGWGSFGFEEAGPIAWPSDGYGRTFDGDPNLGARGAFAPSSIVRDRYIYVYYLDQSRGVESEGRGYGIKVARAYIEDNGIPGPFYTYYNGVFTDLALPEDFNKDNPDFVNDRGGRSSNILSLNQDPQTGYVWAADGNNYYQGSSGFFTVSKIEGTEYYMGIESAAITPEGGVAGQTMVLWLSEDLVRWHSRTLIPNSFQIWDGGGENDGTDNFCYYPKAFNKTMTSTTTIDLSDEYFNIVGYREGSPNYCYLRVKAEFAEAQ